MGKMNVPCLCRGSNEVALGYFDNKKCPKLILVRKDFYSYALNSLIAVYNSFFSTILKPQKAQQLPVVLKVSRLQFTES